VKKRKYPLELRIVGIFSVFNIVLLIRRIIIKIRINNIRE